MKAAMTCCASVALALTMTGCASKEKVKPDPTPVAMATPTAEPTPGKAATKEEPAARYVVRKGDSLWTIASKKNILDDSFRWPLLYRQNRDQITDPDMIEAGQDLNYTVVMSDAEIQDAVAKAKDTPPFVPHAAARK